jgi:hypothetical protein
MEALLIFFQMADSKDKPVLNAPHSFHMLDNAYKKSYIISTLDKFLDEYIFIDEELEETVQTDGVMQLIH